MATRYRLESTADKNQASSVTRAEPDENGIALGRAPDNVLNIVYLSGESAGFARRLRFFPDRLNGSIR